jgi:predicted transglutaminase-like cysteine proteinase
MSAFAQLARVFLLVAHCCGVAYADMYPSQVVVAAANIPDAGLAPENKAGDVAVSSLGVVKPDLGKYDPDKLEPAEPFGLPFSAALPADMTAKWQELQIRILADEKVIAACRADESACSQAARRFLSIVDFGREHEGRARLGLVNRAVNLTIRPVSDLEQYGYPDFWASPLQTLGSRAGDCEDYAIVKYIALHEMGFDTSNLRFVIVRDTARQTDHAVVAVRDGQGWLILDNRTMFILDAKDVRQYQPLFSLDQQSVRAFASAADRITDR